MASVAGFEEMWAALAPVGRSAGSGGYHRQPFTAAERECHAWFLEQARARGLRVEVDGFGNTIAWWDVPEPSGPAVLTGSHLDSVVDGGAYDGPLGVVGALAALDRLRDQGVSPARSVGVAVFVEEEGSRFGRACLGSRLAVGATSGAEAAALADRDGVRLGDAWAAADLDPTTGSDLLADVGCFVELHVEQGRDLVHRDVAVGAASGIWPHGRWRFEFTGVADHAGTTRMGDRADPMVTCAATVTAARDRARAADQRATFGRVEVTPGATNAVPSGVRAWLDARASSESGLAALLDRIGEDARGHADRDGTSLQVVPESTSPAVAFDDALTARVAGNRGWPVIPTAAGHDAGVLAAAGIPSAMLFVRNPTGVSHSPEESASTADCLAGVDALADALEVLAR